MHHQSEAAIVVNDLKSLQHRIDALPAHPDYTKALNAVIDAETAINAGRGDLHQREMHERYKAA